ncbi:MAG TPA: hydrolase [Prolixibacteraceae bacterium]|jgi:hydroxymethylpyrimidine pyrophosphatase-like HAD family hydrolase
MIIAIDFDGTIVEHKYPAIGAPIPFAFDTLKALQKKGHRLILWTHRSGRTLEAAVQYCADNGVEFYAVNRNYPEEKWDSQESRKINADLFVDDRNLGGLPSWGEIYLMICPEEDKMTEQVKKPWWRK